MSNIDVDDLKPLGRKHAPADGGRRVGFSKKRNNRPVEARLPPTCDESVIPTTRPSNTKAGSSSRARSPPPPPNGPTDRGAFPPLLNSVADINSDEQYGEDEQALNKFLKLHPMLSFDATSVETLQLITSMYEKSALAVHDVPIVGKQHDDLFLRPAVQSIGERSCICGDACLCSFMAKLRYGEKSTRAFIGVEFLLPAEQTLFLADGTLPSRRKKCLLCTRYFQNYLYILCRTDPSFSLARESVSLQSFGNVVEPPHAFNAAPDMVAISSSMASMPASASIVHDKDGYKPEAMLFVDEAFVSGNLAARTGSTTTFAWKPVVRFCSSHYTYVVTCDGPRIVQVGIGVDDVTECGLNFRQPPGNVAPSVASAI